jgi:hypothetical protein
MYYYRLLSVNKLFNLLKKEMCEQYLISFPISKPNRKFNFKVQKYYFSY